MKKVQQFFALKIESSRLKDSNFKIKNLTLEQARKNGEVISLSNSQLIRTIQKITNREFSQYHLDKLLEDKKRLNRKKNDKNLRERLKQINSQIDEMLYLPEIISVYFDDKRHFYNILKRNGFLVNGVRYVPFLASAGMIRRDTYLFVDEELKERLSVIFDNERNHEIEIVPAKFAAYYSLYSSSTIPVTFPKIAVVPDLIIKTLRKVDYSTYVGKGVDPKIEEREMEIECNAFDGEGLCSPALARKWAKDLECDYIPSIFGVRAPYIKGMVAVFDFHAFGEDVAKQDVITDIYGNEVKIRDVECIISESMFKLWSSYSDTKSYVSACVRNNLDWGITKVNAEKEKDFARTSYQFLQVLNLTGNDIEKLCEPTLNWLESVSGKSVESTLLYSLGETNFSKDWFGRIEPIVQALILNNSVINDSYLIGHLNKSISKKKNDAKIGRLIFNGNYQTMISDPYALAAHVFGMGVKPLLQEHQHYSQYWNERNVTQVASIRSPIVHSSEVNVLNLQNNPDVNYWYQHIKSGIIFPASGIGMDSAIQGGSDYDLDLVCTINSPEIINGRITGHPILYENKKADKFKINKDSELAVLESQVRQIKTNKIGFYTNLSSTLYALLDNFPVDSLERNTILQRLKYGRVLQGLAIDSAKGILTDPFPEHFAKWKKITEDMNESEKELAMFNNSIVANHRPYFMRWLYSHYNHRYLKELTIYNNITQTRWGVSLNELKELKNRTPEQNDLLEKYLNKSFFIDNNSTMNRITKHIEEKLKDNRFNQLQAQADFDYSVLVSKNFKKPLKRDIDKLHLLFKEYKSFKRSFKNNQGDDGFDSMEQIFKFVNQKAYTTISSNSEELADLAVYLCYAVLGKNSKSFCWSVFGKEIVENMRQKRSEKFVRVPLPSKTGNIEYLWNRYGIYLLNLEDI